MTAPAAADPLAVARLLRGSGHTFESVVRGGSMGRTLPPGSRIRIRCDQPGSLAAGDVAAFLLVGVLVGHRVWGKSGGPAGPRWLLTCGDGSSVCDEPVPEAVVMGRVLAVARGADWVAIPAAPARHGWRAPTVWAHQRAVRFALGLDVRAATLLVRFARACRRAWRTLWPS